MSEGKTTIHGTWEHMSEGIFTSVPPEKEAENLLSKPSPRMEIRDLRLCKYGINMCEAAEKGGVGISGAEWFLVLGSIEVCSDDQLRLARLLSLCGAHSAVLRTRATCTAEL